MGLWDFAVWRMHGAVFFWEAEEEEKTPYRKAQTETEGRVSKGGRSSVPCEVRFKPKTLRGSTLLVRGRDLLCRVWPSQS